MSYFNETSFVIRSLFMGVVFFWAFGMSSSRLVQWGYRSIDLDSIRQNTAFIQSEANASGLNCLSEAEACFGSCLEAQIDLTFPCVECFGERVTCIVTHCYFSCAFGTEEWCAEGALKNCEAGFNESPEIIDNNNEPWTHLCDCNGLLSTSILAECEADLNTDNIIETADLLIFLGDSIAVKIALNLQIWTTMML